MSAEKVIKIKVFIASRLIQGYILSIVLLNDVRIFHLNYLYYKNVKFKLRLLTAYGNKVEFHLLTDETFPNYKGIPRGLLFVIKDYPHYRLAISSLVQKVPLWLQLYWL